MLRILVHKSQSGGEALHYYPCDLITMKTLKDYPTQELKLIYNILHAQLPAHTALLDSEWLQDLQRHLLQKAEASGVSQPTSWEKWLNSEN